MVWYQKGWNKYHAKRTEYGGGRYASQFEASYAQMLDVQQQAGEIKSWEKQVTLDLNVNGKHVTSYRIDFIVHHLDGSREFVETKGFYTPEFRIKWKLFEALFSNFKKHPDDRMVLVTQRNWGPRKKK